MQDTRRTAPALAALCAVLVALAGIATARADEFDAFRASDPESRVALDHGPWNRFLARHLVAGAGTTLLRYGEIAEADRRALDAWIERLAGTDVGTLSRPEQKAFWINLYNGLTVQLVLENYPVDSIADISSGLLSRGPWKRKLARVGGVGLSLDDIEHGILRAILGDPMIHYGVNCAALSCPPLMERAFRGADVDAMLAANAARYVNGRHAVTGGEGEAIRVSGIFVWYKEDFGGSDAAVLDHLRRFARGATAARLQGARRIAGHDYDWSLNDAGRFRGPLD